MASPPCRWQPPKGGNRLAELDPPHPDPPLPHEQVRFAHNSERQFARLLDFYGIEWQYEPRTFTLERDKAGNPVQAFTPDFYLPAYDLYIEITTLNQKLVTKKNRKVRQLKEHHPEIRCKVLYQRDYLHLVVKYGLEEPDHLDEEILAPTRMPGRPEIVRLEHRGQRLTG